MKRLLQSNFIEITLRHGCPPVNLLHIFRTPFSKNTSGRLLQPFICWRDNQKRTQLIRLLLVCVCLFILFHLLASSDCKTSVTYLRCSDQRSFVVSICRGLCQVPLSLYLKIFYFTSKDENSTQHTQTGERTI